MPEGSVGVARGQVGAATSDFAIDQIAANRGQVNCSQQDGDTRGSEGSLNDPLFFTNTNTFLVPGSLNQQYATHKLGLDNDSSLASNSHAIDSESDNLVDKPTRLFGGIENKDAAVEANIIIDRSTIGDSAIGVADFDVSSDLPVPGSEGTVAEFDVLDLQKVSLPRFQFSPALVVHGNGLIDVPPPSLSSMLHPNWVRARINKIKVRFSMNPP
ncbi:MAG: hypothetical protein AAB177_10820 [Nitrospirota bacterium]